MLQLSEALDAGVGASCQLAELEEGRVWHLDTIPKRLAEAKGV